MNLFKKRTSVGSYAKDVFNNKIGLPITADNIDARLEKLDYAKEIYNSTLEDINMAISESYSLKVSFNWNTLDGTIVNENENFHVVKNSMLNKNLTPVEITNLKIRYRAALNAAIAYFIDSLKLSTVNNQIKYLNTLKMEDVTGDFSPFVTIRNGNDFLVNFDKIDEVITNLKYSAQAQDVYSNARRIR